MASRQRILASLLDYVNDELGFRLSAANREKLGVKLDDRLLAPRWPNLESFHRDLLAGLPEAREALIKAITVNHTFFFRERRQLDALVQLARDREGDALAIWSAASSTGEEAYSLAILLLEAGLENFRIVASDVNPRVLHAMSGGVYHESRIEELPRHLLFKYFTREGEGRWRVIPELRSHVGIKRINLAQPIRFEDPFDFILCRNVFIYFDEATRRRALDSLMENLKPGGFLFLGMTEGLLEIPRGLAMASQSTYRRVAES